MGCRACRQSVPPEPPLSEHGAGLRAAGRATRGTDTAAAVRPWSQRYRSTIIGMATNRQVKLRARRMARFLHLLAEEHRPAAPRGRIDRPPRQLGGPAELVRRRAARHDHLGARERRRRAGLLHRSRASAEAAADRTQVKPPGTDQSARARQGPVHPCPAAGMGHAPCPRRPSLGQPLRLRRTLFGQPLLGPGLLPAIPAASRPFAAEAPRRMRAAPSWHVYGLAP